MYAQYRQHGDILKELKDKQMTLLKALKLPFQIIWTLLICVFTALLIIPMAWIALTLFVFAGTEEMKDFLKTNRIIGPND